MIIDDMDEISQIKKTVKDECVAGGLDWFLGCSFAGGGKMRQNAFGKIAQSR